MKSEDPTSRSQAGVGALQACGAPIKSQHPKTANMKSHWPSEGARQFAGTTSMSIAWGRCFMTYAKARTIVGRAGKNTQITKTAARPTRTLLKQFIETLWGSIVAVAYRNERQNF